MRDIGRDWIDNVPAPTGSDPTREELAAARTRRPRRTLDRTERDRRRAERKAQGRARKAGRRARR